MPNPWGAERVEFDFDGSLTLARRLWALADEVERADAARSAKADIARRRWKGRFGDDFVARTADEAKSASTVANGLREEAEGWATAWKKAMDEQNRRNRAHKVAEIQSARGWWERNVGDRVVGDDSDSQVPTAPLAEVPSSPHFAATQQEVSF